MIYTKEIIDELYMNTMGRIIFGDTDINEAFNIGGDKMTIMVRNKKEDRISHHRSFKLKSSKISKKYSLGIPIIFDMEETKDGIIWKWKIDPDANIDKKDIKRFIGDKEKEFINTALKYAGFDIIEYWSLDYKKKEDQMHLDQLNTKYSKGYIL